MDGSGVVGHARGMVRALLPRAWLRAIYQKRFFSAQGWQNLHFGSRFVRTAQAALRRWQPMPLHARHASGFDKLG